MCRGEGIGLGVRVSGLGLEVKSVGGRVTGLGWGAGGQVLNHW